MFRLILSGLLLMAVALGTIYLANMPGGIEFELFGWEGRLPVLATIVLQLVIGATIALVWGFFAGLWKLPGRIGKSRRQSRIKKANHSLADGLLAAEAGDFKTAQKLAQKSEMYADDDRLKVLLEARAAEVDGDWTTAERAWAQLARLPGGQLAGLRGIATAALERGDPKGAEASARAALELNSGADWPFNSLFDLQVARGDWNKALETLALGSRYGLIAGDSLRRRRAVLHTARAAGLPHENRGDAQKALAEAIRAAPGFPPAIVFGARQLMIDGKDKAAMDVLEMGWTSRPHPAIAQTVRQMSLDSDEAIMNQRLQRLITANPDHYESKVLGAEIAMQAGDWVRAVKGLSLLVENGSTGRLCLLMERALKGYGDADEAARWARLAVTASREADWSDLDPKGGAFNYDVKDWARLVYRFGDAGQLVHPRHEMFARELDVSKAMTALPAPDEDATPRPEVKLPPGDMAQPADFVPETDN
ncbi:MAG: heme biosynthesis HemY N-terminal domain-containing protein [Pseudomonadota bacterium]